MQTTSALSVRPIVTQILGYLKAKAAAAGTFLKGNALSLTIASTTTLIMMGVILGSMADTLAVLQAGGIIALATVPLLAIGIILILNEFKPGIQTRNRRHINIGTTLIVVAFAVLTPTLVKAATGSSSAQEPSQAPTATFTASTSPPLASSSSQPSGSPVPSTTGCPMPDPTDPALPPVEVRVIYWCHGDVLTSEGTVDTENYQIKVRPKLANNTNTSMTISINNPSSIRLLVSGSQIDQRWSPPPLTKKTGDKPLVIDCNGGKFWGIPPNLPRDAVLTKENYYSGFATSWHETQLNPGQVAFKPLRTGPEGQPIQEGNLVFQVPLDENGAARIYGLAVIDPTRANKVLGIALFEKEGDWMQKLHPTAF